VTEHNVSGVCVCSICTFEDNVLVKRKFVSGIANEFVLEATTNLVISIDLRDSNVDIIPIVGVLIPKDELHIELLSDISNPVVNVACW
jgi:hypothetical protein